MSFEVGRKDKDMKSLKFEKYQRNCEPLKYETI